MKKIALMMIFGISSVALSAEEYTIQTISAQKEASITPAFEKKVQNSALAFEKKKEGACNVLTVGKYPSAKAAQQDLKKAKAISKDAFVRPVNRTLPKDCESKIAVADPKKSATEPKHDKTATAKTSVAVASAPKEAPVQESNKAVEAHTIAVKSSVASVSVEVKPETKIEPSKTQACENVTNSVYLYDKNLARKSDIHEAIEYYKHSPYHTFKPALTQR